MNSGAGSSAGASGGTGTRVRSLIFASHQAFLHCHPPFFFLSCLPSLVQNLLLFLCAHGPDTKPS